MFDYLQVKTDRQRGCEHTSREDQELDYHRIFSFSKNRHLLSVGSQLADMKHISCSGSRREVSKHLDDDWL